MALPINIESLLSGSAVESNQLEFRRVGTQMLYTEAFVRLPMILKTPVVAILLWE